MKTLFTLTVLLGFAIGTANAQDKKGTTTEKATKIESKETLRKVQAQPVKIDAAVLEKKRENVIRIDASNSKGIVLTDEQREARSKENAANAEKRTRNTEEN